MHQNDSHLSRLHVAIVGQDAARKIVQGAGQFHSGKSPAGNDKSKMSAANIRIRFTICTLEHFDGVIADADGIQQALETQ